MGGERGEERSGKNLAAIGMRGLSRDGEASVWAGNQREEGEGKTAKNRVPNSS